MGVIRIPTRDVGGGPAASQVPRGAAARVGLAASRAIETAGRAVAGVSLAVKERKDAKLFARENAISSTVFEEGSKAIDDELERGVREEGWSQEEFTKRREELTRDILDPHAKTYQDERVKARFEGRIEGIRAAPSDAQYKDLSEKRDNDALIDFGQNEAERVLMGSVDSVGDRIEEFDEGLSAIEESAPRLRRSGQTDKLREHYKNSTRQHYMSELGPLEGDLKWQTDLLQGKFDKLGELTLAADKATGMARIQLLSEELSKQAVEGAALPHNFVEIEGGGVPRAMDTPQQTSLDAQILELEELPQTRERDSALRDLRGARNSTEGWATEFDAYANELDGAGPPVNLKNPKTLKAVEQYHKQVVIPTLNAGGTIGGMGPAEFAVAHIRRHGSFNAALTDWVEGVATSADPASAGVAVELAAAIQTLAPNPILGSGPITTREDLNALAQGVRMPTDELQGSTQEFFNMLAILSPGSAGPDDAVRRTRTLLESRNQQKGNQKTPMSGTPFGAAISEEAALAQEEERNKILEMLQSSGDRWRRCHRGGSDGWRLPARIRDRSGRAS